MAAWNLGHGVETATLLQERWPGRWQEISAQLDLSDEEVSTWRKLVGTMFIPFDPKTLL
jgi:trehalose/maltose hydrolase-like predicted phosphorylase